jgi:hypothetical protein
VGVDVLEDVSDKLSSNDLLEDIDNYHSKAD